MNIHLINNNNYLVDGYPSPIKKLENMLSHAKKLIDKKIF